MIRDLPTTTFFDTFTALARKKGLSPSRAVEELKMNRSVVTSWRKGRIPSTRTLDKLAEYFGVTRQYLLEAPPDESETGSKIEHHENIQKSPFLGLNKSPKERGQLIDRDFVKLVLGLLQIYYPDETTESLADELKMSKKMLSNEHSRKVSADRNWGSRFYSLLESKDVIYIVDCLDDIGQILVSERKKAYYNSLTRIILEYMSEDVLVPEFVREGMMHEFLPYSDYWTIVKSKASENCWLFSFYDTSVLQLGDQRIYCHCTDGQWEDEFPNVERFIMMYTYNPTQTTDYELARFKETLFRLCPNVIVRLNIQSWLLSVNITNGETLPSEQVFPGDWGALET